MADPDGSERDDHFGNSAVPHRARLGRWRVTMSFWSLVSAMIWLFYGALISSLYGTVDTLIAIGLSVAAFWALTVPHTRLGIRFGLNSELLTRSLFGRVGSLVATLLIALTVVYYAVFESSVLATGFKEYFKVGDIRIWYAIVVAGTLPLMLGGVRTWMGRLNGALLPFYVIGLVAAVIVAKVKFGGSSDWLKYGGGVPDAQRALPGWALGFILYMGNYILMPVSVDFSRFSKPGDERFHEHVSFGGVFYVLLIAVNGVVGAFLVQTVLPGSHASEDGVVVALIRTLGFFGLLLIVVSQTRINTLNYYQSSTAFERAVATYTRFRAPHWAWVVAVAATVFVLMLTDVFSYLQQALTWQGIFLVGWVGVVLTHFGMDRVDRARGPRHDASHTPLAGPGLASWVGSSGFGIVLLQVPGVPTTLREAAVPVVLALSITSYAAVYSTSSRRARRRSASAGCDVDPRPAQAERSDAGSVRPSA